MFFSFSQLPESELYNIRAITVELLGEFDNNKTIRILSYRFRKSSTSYWRQKQDEAIEYELLYQPDFSLEDPPLPALEGIPDSD